MFFGGKASAVNKDTKYHTWIPQRYVFGIFGFLALSNAYIQRFNLALTITEMTPPIYRDKMKSAEEYNDCPGSPVHQNHSIEDKKYDFDWSEEKQGVILSSVFWGYVISQIPGGWIAERYGAKHTLGFGMLCSTMCALVTPFVLHVADFYGFIIVRFLMGIGQGALYPSLNVLLSHWAPLQERGRLGALVFAGAQIGTIVSMALTGVIIERFSWSWVFYFYGAAGLVWYACWLLFVSDSPFSNRFISEAEKKYLSEHVADINGERKNLPPTPWSKMLTSSAVWGLVIAQIGHDWGLFTIVSDLPKYMRQVLHYKVSENGFLSAIPYVTMWISAMLCGIISDWLIKKCGLKVTLVRKLFITIAATGPAVGIMAASYSYCDKIGVSVWLTIGMGLMGAFLPSLKVNPLDLSPNYAGSLMAVVGGVGAASGIVTPLLAGELTTHGTMSEWRLVFWIVAVMLVATNIIYLIFGSAEVEPWNDIVSDHVSKPSIENSEGFARNGMDTHTNKISPANTTTPVISVLTNY